MCPTWTLDKDLSYWFGDVVAVSAQVSNITSFALSLFMFLVMIFETFDDVVVAVSAPIDMSLQCDSSLFSSTQFKVTKYIFETYVL